MSNAYCDVTLMEMLPGGIPPLPPIEPTTSCTLVRKFRLLHPRPPHIGFLIDNPQDYYVDWDDTGLDQWREC